MIGVDTNILLRLFIDDSPKQSQAAIESIDLAGPESLRVSAIVLVEMDWVLRRVYKLDKHTVTAILDKLFTRAELAIEGRETVQQALGSYIASSADFADCLIASFDAAAGVEQTYTFDEAASEVAEFKLLECKP